MSSQDRKKKVALVGRPNVGKSTLFNRLSIKEKAIVHDMPGVTRDRKYADAKIGPMEILLIDTPGLEEAREQALEYRMMQQTMLAIEEADLTCLVIDNLQGVTPADKFFANLIRKHSKNSILVVNKCEKAFTGDGSVYKLGFGQPVPISAEHGIGLADLYDAMDEVFKKIDDDLSQKNKDNEDQQQEGEYNEETLEEFDIDAEIGLENEDINLVIAGRPNAGKSTFINALLKEERMLTGPEAGITRESVEVEFKHKDRNFK